MGMVKVAFSKTQIDVLSFNYSLICHLQGIQTDDRRTADKKLVYKHFERA